LASPSQAIKIAENSNIRPFIIAESSDAPTAGASGDSPIMIEAFVSSNSDLKTFIPITDQPAVAKCHDLNLGDEMSLMLGCTIDQRWSKPVSIKVRIDYLGDGDYELSGVGYSGLKATMGRFAVVSFRSMKILISELPCWSADPATWRHAQLDAFNAELLVVRSCSDFKANFPDSGNSALYLDVLGTASNRFAELPYKNCAQETWPINKTLG
jgi:microcystin degradation protein MlrC